MTTSLNGTVPADATGDATGPAPDAAGQRVGVHTGGRAPVHSRGRARARARQITGHVAAGFRHDVSHGTPAEEHLPSLSALRASVHARAGAHAVIPAGRPAYIAWGYIVIVLSAIGYAVLWTIQGLGRTAVAGAVWAVIHFTGVLAGVPVIHNLF